MIPINRINKNKQTWSSLFCNKAEVSNFLNVALQELRCPANMALLFEVQGWKVVKPAVHLFIYQPLHHREYTPAMKKLMLDFF